MLVRQKSKTGSKKNSIPVVEFNEHAEDIQLFLDAHERETTAKADKSAASSRMIDEANKLRQEQCRKQGKLFASVRLNSDEGTVKVTQTERYLTKDQPDDADERLEAIFGDQFDMYFTIDSEYTLLVDQMTDNEQKKLVDALTKAFGQERTTELLQHNQTVKPTSKFTTDSIIDPKIVAKATQATAEGLVKMQAPFIAK